MGTVRKLMVEVVDAHNLVPKDGHGSSSPYVVLDFHGQRRKTRTAVRDLNPVWNETLSFNVEDGAHSHSRIFGDILELDIYHDKNYGSTRRNNSLGQIRLSSTQFVNKGEEALVYYKLEKKHVFSMTQGEIGLKIYYVNEKKVEEAPTPKEEENAPEADPKHDDVKAASVSRSNSETRFNSPPPCSMSMERSSFDLVEKMQYLFVQVVKARHLSTNGNPVVKITVSGQHHHVTSKTTLLEWNQTFAFARHASVLEVSLWDPPAAQALLGGVCFDVTEIPVRDPPDSPLAPQWYRLEGGGAGELMIATWIGTQADESFPDAWKSDTFAHLNSRAKVYQSPKLWYLRATLLEAQDVLLPLTSSKEACFQVKAKLGFQVLKSKTVVTRTNAAVSWNNEDFIFVVAEPVSDHLLLTLENRLPEGPVTVGMLRIPLLGIERRVDDRIVASQWFNLDIDEKSKSRPRVHLRLCFDGGYHVMDEAAHLCSDYRPTARQLWKPPVGMVELGIICCKNLLPNDKTSANAYCVAKYGNKWVRTRTASDNLEPKWNEQYTWKVYDPCTVLTIGVFDSPGEGKQDLRIGKVRVRISALQTGKVYRNTYPLLVLTPESGLKKMGEIEMAIRLVGKSQRLDLVQVYSQAMLPLMHHIKPLGVVQQEALRNAAVRMVAEHLERAEPPLRKEVVCYMLDADSHKFSIRKVRANWYRIINVVAGVMDVVRWIEDTRGWRNPTATVLVHALLVMLVWFPDLIIPSLCFYIFVVGAWNYRWRARDLQPHLDPKMSLAEVVDREEVEEEFDTVPSNRSSEVVRARYEKLRALGGRVQTVLGDIATQGERMQALVTWRDPRATGIFLFFCFILALFLYLLPLNMVAMASGFYYLRHPIFRDRLPSPVLNFFRRLPSMSHRII